MTAIGTGMTAYRERRSREMAAYREGVQRCCLDIKQLDPNNARAVRLHSNRGNGCIIENPIEFKWHLGIVHTFSEALLNNKYCDC